MPFAPDKTVLEGGIPETQKTTARATPYGAALQPDT
jgi:hypothetical protein